MTRERLCGALASILTLLLLSSVAEAAGFRFHGASASTQLTLDQKGYFDGKDYELSVYGAPLFGWESNYKAMGPDPRDPSIKAAGSLLLSVNSGAEFKYRPSSKLYLRSELAAGFRLPLSGTDLTGFLVELPVYFTYRLSRQWELFLSNHAALERGVTPQIFLDQQVQAGTSGAIVYLTFYEQLRPAIAFSPVKGLTLDAGPYFRLKQVNFADNPADADPDYRLFDLGGDLALSYRPFRFLSLRLHYDFSVRFYANVRSRPPQGVPVTEDPLRALRHYVDLRLRTNYRFLSAFGGYGFRLNADNAGTFNYTEHHLFVGLGVRYKTRFSLSAQVFAALRKYTDRTLCEAFRSTEPGPNLGKYVGSDCRDPDHVSTDPLYVSPTPQNSRENLIGVRVEAAVSLFDWFQVTASYELEDAGAKTSAPGLTADDPQFANHRVLGGLTFSL